MGIDNNMSEQNYVDEILTSIDMMLDSLYQSLGNSNNADYKELLEIINRYTDKDTTDLTAFDLKNMSNVDYSRLLSIIGVDESKIFLAVRQFNVFSKALEDRSNMQEFNDALDYLSRIATKVCDFSNEFKTMTTGREDFAKNQSDNLLYLKQVITSDASTEIPDVKRIDDTLGDLGVSLKTRTKALTKIGSDIASSAPARVTDMETQKKVKSSQKYCNQYLEFAKLVADYINKNGLDVDTVPLTAENICKIYDIQNIELVTNIIVGVASAAYFKEYQERLANIDPSAEEVRKEIERLCSFLVSDQAIRISEAEVIVKNKYGRIIEALNNNEDIFSYNDIYLSDYTDEESYNEAKAKKEMPIVYSLAQTLDTYNLPTTGVKDKSEASQMINSLLEADRELDERKFTQKLVA